jgi:hypothetical protein
MGIYDKDHLVYGGYVIKESKTRQLKEAFKSDPGMCSNIYCRLVKASRLFTYSQQISLLT